MKLTRAEMSAALFSENGSMSALQLVKANGLTTLHVEVPDRPEVASVNIVLYSLSGTPVRHLVSETLDAGNYLVGWDGNDDGGRRVQPGVYVAVMTAGSFRETRRLVVR
jgi:flagellar hook assembly protein FlgD